MENLNKPASRARIEAQMDSLWTRMSKERVKRHARVNRLVAILDKMTAAPKCGRHQRALQAELSRLDDDCGLRDARAFLDLVTKLREASPA